MNDNIDINEQLDILEETKSQIKQAIIDKGQEISENDSFRSYVDKIEAIETGIDTSDATAVASDIAQNKTAYVNGQKIIGTYVSPVLPYGRMLDNLDNINNTQISLRQDLSAITFVGDISGYSTTSGESYPITDCKIDGHSSMAVLANQGDVATAIGLTSGKIKSGETILGITGTYTSDATAVASDIANGKTAYVSGRKITGSIAGSTANPVTAGSRPTISDDGSNINVDRGYGKTFILNADQQLRSSISYSDMANLINLTADKIKSGVTILGITGTYSDAMKSYNSETAMNNDIANIQEGEVVKVVENNTTTFYIKETTMKKLVKEEDTLSPADAQQAETQVDNLLGEEETE